MFFRDFLFRNLPAPGVLFDTIGSNFLTEDYGKWWGYSKKVLCEWHHDRLVEIDSNFRLRDATSRLIKARADAHALDLSPLDPKYPALHDFLKR